MPLKKPAKGKTTVDAPLRTTQPSDGHMPHPDSPARVDFGFINASHPRNPGTPGRSTTADAGPETSPSSPSVTVHQDGVGAQIAGTSQRSLEHYWSKASTRQLPEADAQGLRTFKGRQYAQVSGGVVHVGLDLETGLYRAKRASELNPSGPVLRWDPDSNLWQPVQEYGPSTKGPAVRKSGSESELSDSELELTSELSAAKSADSDDGYELASESMQIKPYTVEELDFMKREVRYWYADNSLGSYNRANNGKYPLRDLSGKTVRIRKLESYVTAAGVRYASTQIKPYIKFEGFDAVGRLYEEKLQLRTFTQADVKVPGERALIGQFMVVANRRIAKGEALGVYGGTLSPVRLIRPHEQIFTMLAGAPMRLINARYVPDPVAIVGDNIISRINSNFEYDTAGKPVRQSTEGYNVAVIGFNVEADYPVGDKVTRRAYMLSATFASEDIPAGTELRLNYGYSDEEMGWLFP